MKTPLEELDRLEALARETPDAEEPWARFLEACRRAGRLVEGLRRAAASRGLALDPDHDARSFLAAAWRAHDPRGLPAGVLPAELRRLALSPDGARVVTVEQDVGHRPPRQIVRVHDLPTPAPSWTETVPGFVRGVVFSSDSRRLLLLYQPSGDVEVDSPRNEGPDGPVHRVLLPARSCCVDLGAAPRRGFYGDGDGLRELDLEPWDSRAAPIGIRRVPLDLAPDRDLARVEALGLSPDGTRLAIALATGFDVRYDRADRVYLGAVRPGEAISWEELPRTEAAAHRLRWSPDSGRLAVLTDRYGVEYGESSDWEMEEVEVVVGHRLRAFDGAGRLVHDQEVPGRAAGLCWTSPRHLVVGETAVAIPGDG